MMTAGKIRNSPATVVDVTILIVDDDDEFRRILKRLLEKDQTFNVVGEAVDPAFHHGQQSTAGSMRNTGPLVQRWHDSRSS